MRKNWQGDQKKLEKEFYEQLKAQEAGINKLTVKEYLENRVRYMEVQRAGTGAAQKKAAVDMRDEIQKSVTRSLRNQGIGGNQTKRMASKKASEIMKTLAALHVPDLIAGGHDPAATGSNKGGTMRMGDRKINSSLGAQWPKEGRLAQMDAAAEQALRENGPDAKMNVKLERCK